MKTYIATFLMVGVLAIAGCSGKSQQSSSPQTAGSPPALTNPTDFPLASGSVLLDVKPFSQTVEATSMNSSSLAGHGAGKYSGNEVLAETPASLDDLRGWLDRLKKAPPAGYTYQPASVESHDVALSKYGIDYALFTKSGSAKPRGVVLVVMDPSQVRSKIGMAVDLVNRYRELPETVRQPIDQEVKSKIGFSATEATDPSAPLGMTLSALDQLRSTNDRAIMMIDATKE
jgi:hypothetical protein